MSTDRDIVGDFIELTFLVVVTAIIVGFWLGLLAALAYGIYLIV